MKTFSLLSSLCGIAIFLAAIFLFWDPANTLKTSDINSKDHLNNSQQIGRGTFFDITKAEKTIVAVGEHGQIFCSYNEGKTWIQVKAPFDLSLTSVFLLNDKLGWAAGYDGVILKTIDGGATWAILRNPSLSNPPLFSIWFKSKDIGFAVGADSTVYRTNDGGNTWIPKKLDIQTHLYSLAQTADKTLWVTGSNQALYFSVDEGITWTKIQLPFLTSFFKTLGLTNQLVTFGLRGRIAVWETNGLIKSTIERDENLLYAIQLKDGRIIAAGQRGRILIGQINPWAFRCLQISLQKDISSLIEVSDALIFTGEFGIQSILKSDLGL